ncbi:proton-conducting membrane transporter [Microbacterium sp. SGAir0570]|uniref:Multicomponent Na+:H+ antiporter subunit D n=1 Tax=Microbacterium paludicola TaxID=300019 RepID=A0ABU1I0P5_9MICO|nr:MULTISPECIES: proton-conducting transporter membrane subunit [Microbacterium]MDR6167474.1 multicomponent Na+:H+ antiporter subunit D [Microbacterium paludicola]QCR41387.1 proton-conducting membrane transporter [Microbacterium sp. SGAir0570]
MIPGSVVSPSLIPVVLLLTSLVPALVIFGLKEEQRRLRTALNLAGAIAKAAIVVVLIPIVVSGEKLRSSFEWIPGLEIVFVTDTFSLFFVALSSGLWLVTTVYAIGYLEGAPNRSRFFGFFSLCVTATTGIALAQNLFTFLIFFELLTLVTYPLVAHRGTPEATRGARTYLGYTLVGGVVLLLGVAWLTLEVGPVEFVSGGVPAVAALAARDPATATAIGALLLTGVGVKAALFPLHGWLPVAMVAPAPVSALLHAVAVVKAGAFGIIRVVEDTFGFQLFADLGLLAVLAVVASITIVYGSLRALTQDDLKKRLAYSTVSQVAYIALGAALLAPMATAGAIVHMVNQGFMKITLFFCAGLFAEELKIHRISELSGVGRRMPLTATAFTIAALGMIGLPPFAGFISKWALGVGALDAGEPWVIAVLLTSTILNAGYFLPVIIAMWTEPAATAASAERAPRLTQPGDHARRLEAPAALLVPTLITAAAVVGLGVAAGWEFSPWSLARFIADGAWL